MALTADRDVEYVGENTVMAIQAGAADTLYKGAIVNIGTDGYVKVAADVANEFPIGVMDKQHVADGSTHALCEVRIGMIWLAHTGAAQTDVGELFYATADDTLADSSSNVGPLGVCIGFKTGYLLIDTRQKNRAA